MVECFGGVAVYVEVGMIVTCVSAKGALLLCPSLNPS